MSTDMHLAVEVVEHSNLPAKRWMLVQPPPASWSYLKDGSIACDGVSAYNAWPTSQSYAFFALLDGTRLNTVEWWGWQIKPIWPNGREAPDDATRHGAGCDLWFTLDELFAALERIDEYVMRRPTQVEQDAYILGTRPEGGWLDSIDIAMRFFRALPAVLGRPPEEIRCFVHWSH